MGRGLREVAADVVCTLGMEEDEGKIDALAVSLAEAANKTFGSNSDLETKLMTSLTPPAPKTHYIPHTSFGQI